MYAESYVENDVLNQDPVELVRLLYSKAIERVREARGHLEAGRIPQRAETIAHVMEIILELQATLNLEEGGEIAKNLAKLYDYMQERLAEANGRQSAPPLEEVEGLLGILYEGWSECRSEAIGVPEAVVVAEGAAAGGPRAWTL